MTAADIIKKLADALKFLAKVPEWLLPKALKGWRTIVVNVVIAVAAIFASVDMVGITDAIREVFEAFGGGFDPGPINGWWVAAAAFINALLRSITDTPVGSTEPVDVVDAPEPG